MKRPPSPFLFQKTIDRFQVGQRLTAYYNPERPSDAFLLKRPSFGPYFMLMVGTVLLFFGAACAESQAKRENWALETRSIALIWHGAGLVVFGPYFLLAGRESGMIAVLCAVGYFAFGVFCFWDSQWAPTLNLLRRVYLTLVAGAVLGGIAGGIIGTIVAWAAFLAFNRDFGGPVWMIHGAVIGGSLSIVALVVSALQGKGQVES